MQIQKWIALNRKKLYRFAFAPDRDPLSTRTDSPLLSHHRLTHDELQFVHDRAENWPKELRLRILHNSGPGPMSEDWKIPRRRIDCLLTNSYD